MGTALYSLSTPLLEEVGNLESELPDLGRGLVWQVAFGCGAVLETSERGRKTVPMALVWE